MKRTYMLFIFLCFSVLLILNLGANEVFAQSTELIEIQLSVRVHDINIQEKIANITIIAKIPYFPYNETDIWLQIYGGGYASFQCVNSGKNIEGWFFQGESNQPFWLLEGSGEAFPFDSYTLLFRLDDIPFFGKNITLVSDDQQAYFFGQYAYKLKDTWRTDDDFSLSLRFSQTPEIGFIVEKTADAMVINAIQFLAPIIACYYLLGATRFVDAKENLAGRLRIYLSLFVFSSTFPLTIQSSLPYHSSLTFPEFLLTNLNISTAIFGIFSLIGSKSKKPWEKKKETAIYSKHDSLSTLFSLASFLILYVVIMVGKMNLQLSILLTFLIIPAFAYAYNLNASEKDIKKHKDFVIKIILVCVIALLLISLASIIVTILSQ